MGVSKWGLICGDALAMVIAVTDGRPFSHFISERTPDLRKDW